MRNDVLRVPHLGEARNDVLQVKTYLRHHLGLVGRADALFSDDAVAVIHQGSRGMPRAVNNLALQSLVATFAAEGRPGASRLTISVGFQGGCLDETDVGREMLVLLDELRAMVPASPT